MTETRTPNTATNTETQATPSSRAGDKLIELVTPLIAPLGYEIVHLECQLQRQKILRIFIDRIATSQEGTLEKTEGVTIEDCVKVARRLDEPLDQIPEVDALFKGTYELEVSSPGIDRPLRQPKDYQRFSGQEARIHVYRPLTEEEIGNAKYREKNPKQKNFLGTLKGLRNDRVLLDVNAGTAKSLEVEIPLSLISKANLEPKIDANATLKERENMNATELSRVIEAVGKDRGIKKEIIISALEQALLTAAQKKYGPNAVLEAHYNNDSGEIDLFQFKKVVDSEPEMLDEAEEIDMQEAKKLDPEAVIGDELGIKVEAPTFGRIDAQTAKQVIFQKVRDAEREIVYNEYIHRKGEVITGIARRVERGNLVIDLGKTDALLPRSEIIPGEMFKPGDRVQAYLSDVALTTRGPQLYLTRTSPKYLMKLFETEVPEIREQIVEIKLCAREPGARSKIAVVSKDRDVDPVGACVGMKGIRVQNVIQELKGEKIDIIEWSDNPVMFVQKALQPAQISSIRVDERNRTMEIMVEDDQLSLAIGRKGQNVRLAAQLTGWRLDIISKTKLQKRTAEAIFNLQHIEGVNDTMAHSIYQAGYLNVRQVAEAQVENLQKVPGYDDAEAAGKLKERAAAVVEKAGDFLAASPAEDAKGSFTAQPTATSSGKKDAKTLAEERLQEMMKQADVSASAATGAGKTPATDSASGAHGSSTPTSKDE